LTDLSGNVLFWNAGATRLYGVGSSEMVGQLLARRVGVGSFVPAGWAEALAVGEFEADVCDQRHDGTPVWTHTRTGLLHDAEGRTVGVRLVARDITARLGGEERFRALTDLLPDIISIYDRNGVLTFNSTAAWKTHGYSAEALQGRSTFDLIHPDDRPGVESTFNSLLMHAGESQVVRYRYRNADGTYVWMEAAGRNELNNPHIQGIISVSRDISGQVRTEQLLRDDEQRYRMLFAANPHPLMIFDLETLRFIEVNAIALELYGYTREEFLALTIRDIRPPEDLPQFDAAIARVKQRTGLIGGKMPGVWRHRLKSGRLIDVEVVANRIEWAGRPSHIVLVHDVTERLKLDAKLQQTQKLESLGLLAGGIAHDFNNILTAILGHASLASFDVAAVSPLGESIRIIEESARRASELCRQMLAYSGRGRFSVRAVELSSFVEGVVNLLHVSIGKNCHLLQNLSRGLPAIEADATQLQQVVMNLVINAAEALGAQEGTIQISTRRQYADRAFFDTMYLAQDLIAGEYVVLEVSDTGCGMSPETLARVFDPFFTTKFTGRGLGLAAVLGIVRGHSGAIRVDSQPGRGTTFTLIFPVAAGTALPDAQEASSIAMTARASARTVLVVDDEISVRATARAMLERWGFRVLLANDGVEGVNQYRGHRHEIDLVLLDLTMPRLGGEGAFREIRMINPEARVLLMSGFDQNEDLQKIVGQGLAGFIQKPFTAQVLLAKIGTLLTEGKA